METQKRARSTFVRGLACKILLVGAILFVGASASRAQVSIGIQIGAPPPPRVVVVPPTPAPEYVWVEGYWYPVGKHYRWHAGYWTLPPYQGARWVPPHYEEDGERFFVGYWDGDRGRFEHDHHWDRDHDRDHGRWHDHEDHEGNHHGEDRQH